MTIAQAERFYEQDKKKYDVSKNKELLNWLKDIIKKGYSSFMKEEDLQGFIDNIVNWYELKYPERHLELYEGVSYSNFTDIKDISDFMDIRQLMYRLPYKQLCLVECDYRANGGGIRTICDEEGNVIGDVPVLFMSINRKGFENDFSSDKASYFLLHADVGSGKVDVDYYMKEYVKTDNITLDELLVLFKHEYNKELDFSNLEKCIYNHNCDLELRKRVLQLVALKLLYSRNTTPERGYERAQMFIKEFNEELDLNLTTDEIEEIMNRNYSEEEKIEFSFSIIDDDDNDSVYEEDSGSRRKLSSRVRSLVRTIFYD